MNKLQFITVFTFINLICAFLITNNTNGQSVGFGIKAGPNYTSHLSNFRYVSDDINLELTPTFSSGYNIGFVYRLKLSENYRFQIEPSVVTMGAKYDEGFTLRGFEFQTESETTLMYIQLPFLIQLTTSPDKRTVYGRQYTSTTYHFTTGLYGSYLLSAQFTGTNTGQPVGINFTGDFANDVTGQYSEYDAGIMIGFGLENGDLNRIGLDARLMYSVIDSGDVTGFTFEPKNIGAIFSVYFLL